jgi:hypothetical protein
MLLNAPLPCAAQIVARLYQTSEALGPNYSQIAGRDELFKRYDKRRQEQASDGWSGCGLACMEREM